MTCVYCVESHTAFFTLTLTLTLTLTCHCHCHLYPVSNGHTGRSYCRRLRLEPAALAFGAALLLSTFLRAAPPPPPPPPPASSC